jgi:hypothetical protein
MSYTVPTAAEFKARHTAFASVADGAVTAMLAEAVAYVSTCWAEADYQPALMYLAAHMISEEQSIGGVKAASKAGPIKRVKADTVEIEYAGSFLVDASLSGTLYGRRFLELRRRNSPGVLVV